MPKSLLITGGASGIGAETARLAASQGYRIAVNYRSRAAEADALVDAIKADGGEALAVAADVTKDDDVVRLFDAVEKAFGGIDAVVNSAGYNVGMMRVADVQADILERMLMANVFGTIVSCREAVRRMSTKLGGKGGVIVNVSSQASTFGGRPGRSCYAASKGAIDSFTMGLAREVGDEGIRVNAVRPGMTKTPMTQAACDDPQRRREIEASIPMDRIADPSEVAKPIVWLLSEDASYVSGALLNITGGGLAMG